MAQLEFGACGPSSCPHEVEAPTKTKAQNFPITYVLGGGKKKRKKKKTVLMSNDDILLF